MDSNTSLPPSPAELPWAFGTVPLMLAPMQGVTNRALRAALIDLVRPDTVFTEFLQVRSQGGKVLSGVDRREAVAAHGNVPLVVQLIGSAPEALILAAQRAEADGVRHLNFNLGCPFGRRTTGPAGGALLARPELLPTLVHGLRHAFNGSFSIKIRAGYDDPEQIFALLPLFVAARVDFLIIHPRTVVQKYAGWADHRLTARLAAMAPMPVIANGDILSAADGVRVLETTGAAGLMLGRGAIADPFLIARLRGAATPAPAAAELGAGLARFLLDLVERYQPLFCGEAQTLAKLKEVPGFIVAPELLPLAQELKRARSLAAFRAALQPLVA